MTRRPRLSASLALAMVKPKADEPVLTKQCGHADAEIRNCPYSEDVNNDSAQRCECCRECAHECAMDI